MIEEEEGEVEGGGRTRGRIKGQRRTIGEEEKEGNKERQIQ